MSIQDGAVWLVEVDYLDFAAAAVYGVRPEGTYPEMTLPDDWLGIISLISTLYLGDGYWIGEPGDADRPNAIYEGRLIQPLRSERIAPIVPEDSRRVQRQVGVIEVANGDGSLDALVAGYSIDRRQVRAYFGARTSAFTDLTTMAIMSSSTWITGEEEIQISIEDQATFLTSPLQTTRYGGTGGVDGNSDLAGKPKPLAWGVCRNITPSAVDPANSVYQVHDGAISAVSAVYDRGVALNDASTDHATYALLVAASITAGDYHTCLALGLFRVEFLLDTGQITADILGDATGSYSNNPIEIFQRIVLRSALQSADLDATNLSAAATTYAGASGIYFGSDREATIEDAADEVIVGLGAWWGASRTGMIQVGALSEPGDATAVVAIGPGDLISFQPDGRPHPPRTVQRIGYRINYTVQSSGVAGSVSESRQAEIAEPYRVAIAENSSTLAIYPSAEDLEPIPCVYDTLSDAQTIADRLIGLFAPARTAWQAVAPVDRIIGASGGIDLGDAVEITYPRFGFSTGSNLLVVGIAEDAKAGTATLRLWG